MSFFGSRSKKKPGNAPGGARDHSAGKPSKSVPGGPKKTHTHGGYKSGDEFVKPPHDPGPKSVEEIAEDYGQTGNMTEGGDSGGGGGCCASISSLMTIIVIGVIIVVVIFVLKCTSCI
jgi:hypothetical protein